MALLYSSPLCHIKTAPSTTSNNKLSSSMLLASKLNKSGLHFSKKPSSSTSSLSVRCIKVEVSANESVEDLINDLVGFGLSPTLLPKPDFQRKDFPPDFLFGASTSAIQVSLKFPKVDVENF